MSIPVALFLSAWLRCTPLAGSPSTSASGSGGKPYIPEELTFCRLLIFDVLNHLQHRVYGPKPGDHADVHLHGYHSKWSHELLVKCAQGPCCG